jgi:gamma-glutamyltranspeptidase/glutathione hydrolase
MRAPVFAENVVATSQPLAAQAGLDALARGGNAIDAALAAAITLTVVEPTANGIGGDAFALVWDGEAMHGLNGSGRAPAAWTPDRFQGHTRMPEVGWDSVTVPGAVSAWVALSDRFGALGFDGLFEAAIRYARDGFPVSPGVALAWARAAEAFSERRDFLEAFAPAGRAPSPGERWCSPEQAETLGSIARSKGASFYEGRYADRMVEHALAQGGALTHADLAAHEATWVQPLDVEFRGRRVHELPPNGQGLTALIALGVLESLDEAPPLSLDDPLGAHLIMEAIKIGALDVSRHVADPDAMLIAPETMLEPTYLARAGESIDRAQAWPPPDIQAPDGGTVLIVAADRDGRMVTLIQSNFMGFGSGVVVPGTGIALQNRGAGFSLRAGHANEVAPSKRPFHTILPAMASRDGVPELAFGVMGGPMQPQGHVQLLTRLYDEGLTLQQAIERPRLRWTGGAGLVAERGVPTEVLDGLVAREHELPTPFDRSVAFGGAQAIRRAEAGWEGASDPRRDGQAIGR